MYKIRVKKIFNRKERERKEEEAESKRWYGMV